MPGLVLRHRAVAFFSQRRADSRLAFLALACLVRCRSSPRTIIAALRPFDFTCSTPRARAVSSFPAALVGDGAALAPAIYRGLFFAYSSPRDKFFVNPVSIFLTDTRGRKPFRFKMLQYSEESPDPSIAGHGPTRILLALLALRLVADRAVGRSAGGLASEMMTTRQRLSILGATSSLWSRQSGAALARHAARRGVLRGVTSRRRGLLRSRRRRSQ